MEQKMEAVLNAFRKHMFEAEYFETANDAVEWIASQVSVGQIAGFGGSETVKQIGLRSVLRDCGLDLMDPEDERVDAEAAYLGARDADVYFCSANALLEDGSILNCDGTGNRVSAMCYGPGHVYIVAGVNKLVPDLDAAEERLKATAVKNCQILGKKTPCAVTGECSDCLSADRSCRAYLLLRRPTRSVPVSVVIINQELGL